MAFPVVIGPGGKRYELHEGMKQNFLSLYGEWENGTIMCPSLFPRDFISPVGDLPGVAPLEQHVLDTIRGDDAEEKIFEILKRFGEEEKQPMFVVSKLKITELFMKYCMPDLTFQELKNLNEKRKKETENENEKKLDVEIDFAIVHLNIGVILIEVKATDKWPKRKAFNQLSEGEKIIKGLLHEDSHIPVYKVVALPSMDGSGYCKDDFVILKKSDVGSCEEFSHWMHSYFNAEKCGSQEKQELRNLLYKLVGERTRVDSSFERFSDNVHPEKVLSERCKNIWSQACLRQRYEFECSKRKEKGKKPTAGKRKLDELTECSTAEEKGKKPTGDKRKLDELTECSTAEDKGKTPTAGKRKLDELTECSTAEEKGKTPTAGKRKLDELTECSTAEEKGKKSMRLVKTADEPGLAVMAKDIVFLNPEQLCIFEGSIHQLISGAPGTGKTILLQYKALECVRKGEKVVIFVPPPLNKKYEAFFEEKEASSGVSIYTWEDFANLVPESEEKFHLFVDELQILFANKKHLEFHLVSLVKKQKNFDNCYCWFAYDETQALKTWDLDLLTHSDILKFRAAFLGFIVTITDLNDQEKTRNYKFVESHLKTVMRSTEQVFEFVNKFAHKTGFYSKMLCRKEQLYKSKHGDDVPPFLKEYWKGVIGHRVGGHQVEEVETNSLKKVLESILGEVHVNRQKLKEVAVLVTSDWMLEELSSMCKNVGIPLCAVGEAKDALVLDHGGKTHSFEWPVVIAVCEIGLHRYPDSSMLKYYHALWFLIFSRAVVKLVVFNVTGHLKNLMRRRRYRNPQSILSSGGPGEGL